MSEQDELSKRAEEFCKPKPDSDPYCYHCAQEYFKAGALEVLGMIEEWIPQEKEVLKYDIEDYPAAEELLRYLKQKLGVE